MYEKNLIERGQPFNIGQYLEGLVSILMGKKRHDGDKFASN